MKKVLCLIMCILLILSLVACNANDDSEEEASNQQVPEDRQINREPTEIDPILKELADVILENNDVFENLENEKPNVTAINEQMLNMMNQNMGSFFICGVNIFSENFNITIYQSSNSEVDAELLKNFEGFNRENRPIERPEINDSNKDRPKDSENFNNSRFNRGMMFDFEDSDIKILGNYIVIANTDNNEEVFKICESQLNN